MKRAGSRGCHRRPPRPTPRHLHSRPRRETAGADGVVNVVMSIPAENDRPAPATTSARIESSATNSLPQPGEVLPHRDRPRVELLRGVERQPHDSGLLIAAPRERDLFHA